MKLSVLTPILILTDDLELHTNCDRWNVLGAGLTDQQHSSGLGLLWHSGLRCGKLCPEWPVPAFLTSGQWPAVRDLPGSRDRGRCLEQELQFCSCRWQACSYQSMGTGEWRVFFLVSNVSESAADMYYLLGLPENVFFYFIVFHFILLSLNLGFIFVIFVYLSFNFIRRGGFKGDGRNLSDWVMMIRTLPTLLIH